MSDRLPPTSLYPTIIRALAITAIVLGSLGALIAAYGLLNVFLMSAGVFSPQPPPNLPAAMRESFLELMEVQRGVAWYAVFPTALSGLVSLFMVIAGVQSLQQKEVGLMTWAALAAALVDFLSYVVMQIVNFILMKPAIDQYLDSITSLGAGPQAEMIGTLASASMTGGVVFGIIIGLLFVGFWIWAYITLNNHDKRINEVISG